MTTPVRPTRKSVARGVHYVAFEPLPNEYAPRCVAALITHVDGDGSSTLVVFDHTPQAAAAPGLGLANQFTVVARRDEAEPLAVGATPAPTCTGRHYTGGTWHLPPEEVL